MYDSKYDRLSSTCSGKCAHIGRGILGVRLAYNGLHFDIWEFSTERLHSIPLVILIRRCEPMGSRCSCALPRFSQHYVTASRILPIQTVLKAAALLRWTKLSIVP